MIEGKPKKETLYEARFTLGYVFLSLNRPAPALEQFLAIVNAPGLSRRSPDAVFISAEIYEKKFGEHKKAGKLYKKYLNIWPHGRLAKRAARRLVQM